MQIACFDLFDSALRQQYDDLFEECPDAFVQQSTWWAEVIAEIGPDEPYFLLALEGGRALAGLPLYLFRGPYGPVLTSVPQAGPLGGVFCRRELTDAERACSYAQLLGTACDFGRESQCLALSIITNPRRQDRALYEQVRPADFVFENFTQSIDLNQFFAPNGDVLLPNYRRRSNLSRNLAKARTAELRTRQGTALEFEELFAVHLKRHAELGAAPLDCRLLRNIARVLVPRGKAQFLVVAASDRIASWAVYLHHREVLDVLRLNMDSAYADIAPNFLNTDESLRAARKIGVQYYNWQSSPSRESGVYRYKQQWGATESLYYYLTWFLVSPEARPKLDLRTLQQGYPLHFIVPYLAAPDFLPGYYRKA